MKTVKDYVDYVRFMVKQKKEKGPYYPIGLVDLLESNNPSLEIEIDKALNIFYKDADLLEEYHNYVFVHNPIGANKGLWFENVFLDSILESKDVYKDPLYINIVNYCIAVDLFEWEWEDEHIRGSVRDKCLRKLPTAYFKNLDKSNPPVPFDWFIFSSVTFDSIIRVNEGLVQCLITLNFKGAKDFLDSSGLTLEYPDGIESVLARIQQTLEHNLGLKVALNYFHDNGPNTTHYEKYDPKSKSLVYNATPAYGWKGLSFRSEQEVRVAKALDALGVTFGPNTGLRVTEPDRRHTREVDFLVIIDGNVGVLEVDSKQYHDPEKDAIRDANFKEKGLKFIKRYSYQECLNAQSVATDFVASMKKFFSQQINEFFSDDEGVTYPTDLGNDLESTWHWVVFWVSHPVVRLNLIDRNNRITSKLVTLNHSEATVSIPTTCKLVRAMLTSNVQEIEFAFFRSCGVRLKVNLVFTEV